MDYSVHTWDAQQAVGEDKPLAGLSAQILTPFMFILLQYTVDAQQAGGKTVRCGLQVSGETGGEWTATVDNGVFSYQPGLGGAPATLSFEPSDFVLSCFQRRRGGTASGDPAAAEAFRDLFFKI